MKSDIHLVVPIVSMINWLKKFIENNQQRPDCHTPLFYNIEMQRKISTVFDEKH